jgi:hypothetical protein
MDGIRLEIEAVESLKLLCACFEARIPFRISSGGASFWEPPEG